MFYEVVKQGQHLYFYKIDNKLDMDDETDEEDGEAIHGLLIMTMIRTIDKTTSNIKKKKKSVALLSLKMCVKTLLSFII